MNKKGISLIELLGALVIMGIAISMSAILINFFVLANNKITTSNRANYESILFIQTMKSEFDALEPNEYDTCRRDTCLILIEEYTYELNDISNELVLVVLDTPIEVELKFENLSFYKDNTAYIFDGFTLSADSELIFEEISNVLYITFDFYLVSAEGDIFDYTMTYSYSLSNIPSG